MKHLRKIDWAILYALLCWAAFLFGYATQSTTAQKTGYSVAIYPKGVKAPQMAKKRHKKGVERIVSATYYNPGPEQGYKTGKTTADGSQINEQQLAAGLVRWVALSRDLLKRWGGPFNYGDTIQVKHKDERLCGLWVVRDCMNARFTNKIDFLVPLDKGFPGLSHGLQITKYN